MISGSQESQQKTNGDSSRSSGKKAGSDDHTSVLSQLSMSPIVDTRMNEVHTKVDNLREKLTGMMSDMSKATAKLHKDSITLFKKIHDDDIF